MGRHEWERGELILSTVEFPKFRKALVQALNAHRQDLLTRAQEIYDDLQRTAEAEKGQPLEARLDRRLDQLARHTRAVPASVGGYGYSYGMGAFVDRKRVYGEEDMYQVRKALIGEAWNRPQVLKRPVSADRAFQADPLPPAGDPRRALVRASNQQKAALLAHARLIYSEALKDPSKDSIREKVLRQLRVHPVDAALPAASTDVLLRALVATQPARLSRPTAKSLPPFKASDVTFDEGETSLRLDPTKRTIHWDTGDNKNAVSHAWESQLGKTLDRLLKKVSWTRGTGGTFWGNDEYNQSEGRDYADEGGSYTTQRFGPLGKDVLEAAIAPKVTRRRR